MAAFVGGLYTSRPTTMEDVDEWQARVEILLAKRPGDLKRFA